MIGEEDQSEPVSVYLARCWNQWYCDLIPLALSGKSKLGAAGVLSHPKWGKDAWEGAAPKH